MIGGFARGAEELEPGPSQFKFIFLVEENGGIDGRAIVARPWPDLLGRPAESRRVARGKKACQPGSVIDKLNVVPLRDDRGSRFFPKCDSANVVGVTVGQNNESNGSVALRSQ